MNKSILIIIFMSISFFARAQDPEPCASPTFVDTALYFFISEIKPVGPDRFIEIYNCRDHAYNADRWYVYGLYSNLCDSNWTGTIAPHSYTIIPAPSGLGMMDGIKIVARTDTIWITMASVAYTITDPTQSISLCGWFQELPPTPGAPNDCITTTVASVVMDEQPTAINYFSILGQELSALPDYGWCIIWKRYRNGETNVSKKFMRPH